MEQFEGRVAVVTGAASGIGLATATRFAQRGMRLVLADIETDALDAAVAQLFAAGHEVIGVPTDVSKLDQIERLANETIAEYGSVNVIHNNAGVVRAGTLEELTIEDWEWVLGVDLWSVIYGVKVFLPLIKEAGEGHVLNTASTAGLQATANIGPYNVSKFGVVALTETLRLELQGDRSPIGASVLCPGAVQTLICDSGRNREATGVASAEPSATDDAFREAAVKITGAGLDPSEVADMVLAGIERNDFWIVTHPGWLDVIGERAALMREGKLATGFGG